jgi:hypothetical protein
VTVPAEEAGSTAVQLELEMQVGTTVLEPTRTMSAPLIGKKPVPVIVTFVEVVVAPVDGVTLSMELDVSSVAYARHMRAARPG